MVRRREMGSKKLPFCQRREVGPVLKEFSSGVPMISSLRKSTPTAAPNGPAGSLNREPDARASSCVSPASKMLAVAPRMLSKTDGEIPSGRASRSIVGWTRELAGVMAACHCASVVVLAGAL